MSDGDDTSGGNPDLNLWKVKWTEMWQTEPSPHIVHIMDIPLKILEICPPNECTICNVGYINVTDANNHLLGKKHLAKIMKTCGLNSSNRSRNKKLKVMKSGDAFQQFKKNGQNKKENRQKWVEEKKMSGRRVPVSYTHLTLPTKA